MGHKKVLIERRRRGRNEPYLEGSVRKKEDGQAKQVLLVGDVQILLKAVELRIPLNEMFKNRGIIEKSSPGRCLC